MTWKRTDSNQSQIVKELRQIPGVSVTSTSDLGKGFPDLVVGFRGMNYLFEIKTETGELTADEQEWHDNWKGTAFIARSTSQILRVIGLIKDKVND